MYNRVQLIYETGMIQLDAKGPPAPAWEGRQGAEAALLSSGTIVSGIAVVVHGNPICALWCKCIDCISGNVFIHILCRSLSFFFLQQGSPFQLPLLSMALQAQIQLSGKVACRACSSIDLSTYGHFMHAMPLFCACFVVCCVFL